MPELKQATRLKYGSQVTLADEAEFSRDTVINFLNARPVDHWVFLKLCELLEREPDEIADFDPGTPPNPDQNSDNEADNTAFSSDIYPFDPTSWFPEGSVPPNSPFYLERPDTESLCYETLVKPGSLIRIKAPKLMGKTSLLRRIEAYAKKIGYRTVRVDLKSENRSTFTDVDYFLQWFCRKVGKKLRVEKKVNDFWDAEFGSSNEKCTDYFGEYILATSKSPVVLTLDNVERLFPYQELAEDFFGLLRDWHEDWKSDDIPIWQNLRLVLAYSTEEYVPLDIKVSPFNVGVPVELNEFDEQQIEELAKRREVVWTKGEIQQLMDMVGGHPYLVQLALYQIANTKMPLEQLLAKAPTEEGIYNHHLRSLLDTFEQVPELSQEQLTQALKKVVTSDTPVKLPSMQIQLLVSLGLVKKKDNQVEPRCQLYREYFRREL
ncbi:MAG: hypothetical protein F6K47_08490 [Symploca sp. SIO2E6]|nr:hypothetical protein [Symploca sp. SIO2E6]